MDGNLVDVQTERERVNVTCGNFDREEQAQEWLSSFLRSCRYEDGTPFFRCVNEQVRGIPLYRHHRQEAKKDTYRCDILTLPSKTSVCEHFGAIVFDIKQSGIPIGPGLNQIIDYRSSVFDVSGVKVVPSFGFLFPCKKQHAATASWMAHQSIGSVFQCEYNGHLVFFTGEERLLEFDSTGTLHFITARPRSGRGSGSR